MFWTAGPLGVIALHGIIVYHVRARGCVLCCLAGTDLTPNSPRKPKTKFSEARLQTASQQQRLVDFDHSTAAGFLWQYLENVVLTAVEHDMVAWQIDWMQNC